MGVDDFYWLRIGGGKEITLIECNKPFIYVSFAVEWILSKEMYK